MGRGRWWDGGSGWEEEGLRRDGWVRGRRGGEKGLGRWDRDV